MALYDTTVPYTLLNNAGITQHFFRIPRANLALPASVIGAVTAQRFGSDNPVADLAATYLHRLAKNLGADPRRQRAGRGSSGSAEHRTHSRGHHRPPLRPAPSVGTARHNPDIENHGVRP
jgi:hypothetical protein